MILQEKISSIDLPAILESDGIELIRSGNRFQFKCCFHDDQHPSGSLRNNGKWRFHCFGCGASGDAIDFVMKLHGLNFRDACRHLCIESGPLSRAQKVKIKKNKQRYKIIETFKRWELAAIDDLRDTISTAYKIAGRWKTIEDFERGAMWLDPVADLQGQLDTLMVGSEADRVGVYRRWLENGHKF